jgi:hypothetical protein
MTTFTKEDTEGRILLLNLAARKVLGGLTPLEVFTGRHGTYYLNPASIIL